MATKKRELTPEEKLMDAILRPVIGPPQILSIRGRTKKELQQIKKSLLKILKGAPECTFISPRECEIIKLRYGLGSGVEHTIEEIAHIFHKSSGHISRIEARAMRKLQNLFRRPKKK